MVTITHDGFHGYTKVRFRPIDIVDHPQGAGPAYLVSARTAKRLNDACCGMGDCQCGEGIADIIPWPLAIHADEADGYVLIPAAPANVRGHYPQNR